MTELKARQAFSLIEVLMAIFVMSVTAIFLAGIIPMEFAATQEVKAASKAAQLAQKYIEDVKQEMSGLYAYNLIEEGTTPPVEITSEITSDGQFTISTNVYFVGDTGREDDMKEVQVTFQEADEDDPIIDVSTIIAKPE